MRGWTSKDVLKRAMPSHQKFEELCALAVSGNLEDREWSELDKHLQVCEECRAVREAFKETASVLSGNHSPHPIPMPAGMADRFAAKAKSLGIHLELLPSGQSHSRFAHTSNHPGVKIRKLVWGALAASVLMFTFLSGMQYHALHSRPSSARVSSSPASVRDGIPQDGSNSIALSQQLADAKRNLDKAEDELAQSRSELSKKRSEVSALTAQIETLQKSSAQEKGSVVQPEGLAKAETLQAELDRVRSELNTARANEIATENELKVTRDKVAGLNEQLSLAQELNATLKEAKELITDRNVRVLNILPKVVDDKMSSARGHIFYVPGKELVFYAYDLPQPRSSKAEPSFYVWGQSQNTPQKIVNLGRFQMDKGPDAPWFVKVTDPTLLAQIDSVFVTAEPHQARAQSPTGKRMLDRVLDEKASQ